MKNPACELWNREYDKLFRIYIIRARTLHTDRSSDFVNFLRNRYGGRSEARVRSLLAEIHSCTLHVVWVRAVCARLGGKIAVAVDGLTY